MPMTREQGRLVHVLLREQLGNEAPPDLTARILQRTVAARPPLRRGRLLAVAAGLVLAVGAALATRALLNGPNYPSPAVTGDWRLLKGERLERGALLTAGRGGARVVLGGYARLTLGPGSCARLQGHDQAEEVFLESGSALCDVDRNVGTFLLRTEVGTVSVKGTKFAVRILNSDGEEPMITKQLVVSVLVGSVVVSGAWGSTPVLAGEEKLVAAAGPAPVATQRITIKGLGKALGDASGKMDPAAANATVTLDDGTVYYVHGWAGVIVAKKGDGKTVEVSGYVGVKDGKKTITGKSVDVKVIVVE